jgi:hypothetical protein
MGVPSADLTRAWPSSVGELDRDSALRQPAASDAMCVLLCGTMRDAPGETRHGWLDTGGFQPPIWPSEPAFTGVSAGAGTAQA